MRRRAGWLLAEVLTACLVASVLAAAAAALLGRTARGVQGLREGVLLEQIALDLVDRLAAGEARELLSGERDRDGRFRRELDARQLDELLGGEPVLAALAPRVVVALAPDLPACGAGIVRSGEVRVQVFWTAADRSVRELAVDVITDRL